MKSRKDIFLVCYERMYTMSHVKIYSLFVTREYAMKSRKDIFLVCYERICNESREDIFYEVTQRYIPCLLRENMQ